jgi:tripartite-type tricarboxylate transporter receptor subunit TctC
MKRTLVCALWLLCGAASGAAWSQTDYPTKPIRVVVGFPPGGGNDIIARLLGAKLQEAWGQSVVIDNRPGANSNIAIEAVAKAAPDGYTLLFNAAGMVINPAMYENFPVDTIRDFEPISQVATFPFVLAIHPSVPARSVKEFIALAKSQPGKLNYAAGAAAFQFAAELFKQQAGIDIKHIPYKGSVQAISAVLANDVQATIVDSLPATAHISSGRLRALAVTAGKRATALPDVPTMMEAGVADYDISGWAGLFAPAGTPRPIVTKLTQQTVKIVQTSEFRDKLLALGSEPVGSSAEELAAIMKSQLPRFKAVAKTANIKAE